MIEIEGITKSFGQLQVLKGIDLNIDKGEVVSIVGPSGAGKTTLLQIIGTLDRADSGRVIINGTDVSRMKEKELSAFRNKEIGFVFQFHQLLPEFTALENVTIPALIKGVSAAEAKKKSMEMLDFLGLSARASHKPAELSGGEKQRVAVARALINNPSVVLADEPSGSLDTKNKEELHNLFFELRDKLGQTFVIVTHDEGLASQTDRTIHMLDGRLPTRYMPDGCKPGDVLNVFIYLDMDERLIATTLQPYVKVGEFACLEVAWVNQYGAFLDWGLMKDLFVPFREQKMKMQKGNSYVVHVHLDEDSYRIVASAKIEKYLSKEMPEYRSGDEVDIMIWQKTDLGFKVIVDNKFAGLIFKNEIFKDVHTGMKMKAYVKQVRPDGKIDIELQKGGAKKVEDFADVLLEYIRKNGGITPLNDKTDAEVIYETFGVSKKTFKKAVGDLYKKRLIVLEGEQGMRLA